VLIEIAIEIEIASIGESLDNDPDFGPDFDFGRARSCCTTIT